MKQINNHRELILVLLVILCSLNARANPTQQTDNQFTPSWFNFKKSQQQFTLSNPFTEVEIEFNVKQHNVRVIQASVSNRGFWRSGYQSQTHLIQLIGKRQTALIRFINTEKQTIQVTFNGLKTLNVFDFYQAVDGQGQQQPLLLPIKQQLCRVESNRITCQIKNMRDVYVFYHNQQQAVDEFSKFKQELQRSQSDQIQEVASRLGINLNQIPYGQQTVKFMITNTLSSLCVQPSEYQGYQFYGFCSNSNPKQIEKHYSLLTIDILFKYNSHLAAWLTENFLELLQQKLFYSFSGKEWIPIPEHVEVFLTYIKYLKEDSKLSQEKIKKKITKVIEIQNGLINNLLLSEVNHLSEEINYRQQNKVHPSILKMLNQVWKTDLPRAKVSSIYAESFTSDFFYHQKNQKLETSVGKMIWLIKLINQHIKVIRNYGDSYQKEALEQLVSLSKVMNGYALDDSKTQSGDFFSIVNTQNLRVYSKSLGYESLLPFSYGISPAFPIKTIFNLTTPIGLASMPLSHHKVIDTYNFRGNINLYFNQKIIFGMIQRCSENPQLKAYLNGLNKIVDSIQNLISRSIKQYQTDLKPTFFTSWNPKGEGMSSENYLSILNLSFLKSFETLPEEKDQKTQQSTK